jgi:alcohol dehydrogenase class IV
MLPTIAIIDPELTLSAPPHLTASTGLDALTQVVEAFVSRKSNPYTDALCREGTARAGRSLRRVFEKGDDAAAREDMALTSLFSGLALANAGLGAVHGLAGPLGGLIGAPHGALCAGLLPHVMEANITLLQENEPTHETLSRYDEVAQLLTGVITARATDGVEWLRNLSADLQVKPLSALGLDQEGIEITVEKAQHASSMKGNPVNLTARELRKILRSAL